MLGNFFKPLFKKVIEAEDDDFEKVVLLQLAIFMIITVLMILKPLGTSLMLSTYGIDIMPIAFVSIAIAAIFIHFGLNLLRRSFALNHAIIINFAFHILIISAIAAAIYYNLLRGYLTVAVYVYISLFSVITVTLFFQYCQSLLSIREAKRVLSYVGVGAIAGGVFGGYFASATVSYFGNLGLLISAVAFLCFSALSLRKVHQKYGADLIDESTESEWIGGQFFRTLKNKHVVYIVGITFFAVISSKLLDYLFNAVAFAHFDDQEALTAFFGFWFSSINVIGLMIQLFLVNALIDRLGVTYSMSIMPVMILGSLLAFIYLPILSVGIIMKMVDGSMKQSIYKTSTEINIMPLTAAVRERAKSLIDVVVDSIATGISGGLIYLLINKVSLPLWVVTMTTVVVVMLWLVFILLSKKTYLNQLSKLVYNDDKEDEELTESPIKYIEHLLKDSRRKSETRFKKLKKITVEAESPIKTAAIEIIGEEYKLKGLNKLNHLKKDHSYIVRKKYFEEELKFINSKSELNELYKSTNPENQILLTGALARSTGQRHSQQEKYQIKKRINDAYTYLKLKDAPSRLWRTWMTAVAHSKFEKYYPILQKNLQQNSNDEMKMYALFAVMRGKLKRMFPEVIDCKVNTKNRKRWHKTLATFPKKLLNHLKSIPPTNGKQLVRLIPVLKYIDKQSHLDYLFSILEHPRRGVRIEALKTIGVMRRRYPYLKYNRRKNNVRLRKNITQLKEILKEIGYLNELKKMDQTSQNTTIINQAVALLTNELNVYIHILFVLLGLVTDSDEMMKCYYGLLRGKRQETLDYLDQLLSYSLRKRILPLLKTATSKELNSPLFHSQKVYLKRKDFTSPNLKRIDPSLYKDLKKTFNNSRIS